MIAHGKLTQRDYESRDGDKRAMTELAVDEIGTSTRYATLAVRKATRAANQPARGEDP